MNMSERILGFSERKSVEQVEEGQELAPRFDEHGLIPVVTTDWATGEVLMHAYMNALALSRTIETGEAHYYSRSQQKLWRQGETNGRVHRGRELCLEEAQH